MIMMRMICGVFIFMSCLLLSACGMSHKDYAKQTTVKSFPHVPIGKALDNYFEDTEWEYRGEDKELNPNYKHIVVFTGTHDGKKEYIAFGSKDGKKFEIVNEVSGIVNPKGMYDEKNNENWDMNIWLALMNYQVPKGDDNKGKVDKYVEIVKKSPIKNLVVDDTKKLVGDMSVESAIKYILDNDDWKAFNGPDGEKVVEVSGTVSNKPHVYKTPKGEIGKSMVIQFLLDDNDKVYGGYSSMGGITGVDVILSSAIKASQQADSSAIVSYNKNSNTAISIVQKSFSKAGIKGNVVATSYGNSDKGYLTQFDDGKVLLMDNINKQMILVTTPNAIDTIAGYKGSTKRSIELSLIVLGDTHDRDAASGTWKDDHHLLPVRVEYNYENGKHVPYMIKSGYGASPASYDNYLYEQKNVDAVNMIIEEAAFLR